jgi:hypothetical protein
MLPRKSVFFVNHDGDMFPWKQDYSLKRKLRANTKKIDKMTASVMYGITERGDTPKTPVASQNGTPHCPRCV